MRAAKRKKVVLGIDERVPSLIAASILRNQDFELLAVHFSIDLGDRASLYPSAMRRSNLAKIQAACDSLGIPLRTIDVTDEALAIVYDPYWVATLSGKGDAPSVRWLRDLLLPRLTKIARQFGADHIATGHFARNSKGVQRYHDAALDQSLAFGACAPEDLAGLLLPIGEVSPDMIVRLGLELGAIAKAGPGALAGREALEEDRSTRGNWGWGLLLKSAEVQARSGMDVFKPGPYRSTEELAVGEHDGVPLATVGDPVPGNFGQFVVEIQPQTRMIRIGPEPLLLADRIFVKDVVWTEASDRAYRPRRISAEPIPIPPRVTARPQPRAVPIEGTLAEYPGKLADIRLDRPIRALMPGQTLVFSKESQIVGSATVAETSRAGAPRSEIEPETKAE